MKKTETDKTPQRRPFVRDVPTGEAPAAPSTDDTTAATRRSIFDASYAPVGAEYRKKWSRLNRTR